MARWSATRGHARGTAAGVAAYPFRSISLLIDSARMLVRFVAHARPAGQNGTHTVEQMRMPLGLC